MYASTRGGQRGVTFEDCILTGYADDGGLFVPEVLPQVSQEQLKQMSSLSFQELCVEVLSLFIARSEVPLADLTQLVGKCFSHFERKEIIPVVALEEGVFVAELFHGPTLAFKDLGQQVLCALLDYFAAKRGTRHTLLCSTTGDTGPAAIAAVQRSANLQIFCCYPLGQVSRLQELQMTSVVADNVTVVAFEGGGDDMDAPIKRLTSDGAFRAAHRPVAINSINLGRVVVQAVHYFFSYFQVCRATGRSVGAEVDFCVPCGALGNIAAGLLARLIGLPIATLMCGVNSNNILHRAVSTGAFHRHAMTRTVSEAINTQLPYNFERVIYYMAALAQQKQGNSQPPSAAIRDWMQQVDATGANDIPAPWLAELQAHFRTATVSDAETIDCIRSTFSEQRYLADPHTAVGLVAARSLRRQPDADSPSVPVCLLSTAHPAKFESVIRTALEHDHSSAFPAVLAPGPAWMAEAAKSEKAPVIFRAGEDWAARTVQLVEDMSRRTAPSAAAVPSNGPSHAAQAALPGAASDLALP